MGCTGVSVVAKWWDCRLDMEKMIFNFPIARKVIIGRAVDMLVSYIGYFRGGVEFEWGELTMSKVSNPENGGPAMFPRTRDFLALSPTVHMPII